MGARPSSRHLGQASLAVVEFVHDGDAQVAMAIVVEGRNTVRQRNLMVACEGIAMVENEWL